MFVGRDSGPQVPPSQSEQDGFLLQPSTQNDSNLASCSSSSVVVLRNRIWFIQPAATFVRASSSWDRFASSMVATAVQQRASLVPAGNASRAPPTAGTEPSLRRRYAHTYVATQWSYCSLLWLRVQKEVCTYTCKGIPGICLLSRRMDQAYDAVTITVARRLRFLNCSTTRVWRMSGVVPRRNDAALCPCRSSMHAPNGATCIDIFTSFAV